MHVERKPLYASYMTLIALCRQMFRLSFRSKFRVFLSHTNTANNDARLTRDLKRPARSLPVPYLRDSGLRLTVSSVALRTGDPSLFHFSAGYPPSQELGLLALRRRGLHLRSLLLGLLVRVRVRVRVRG